MLVEGITIEDKDYAVNPLIKLVDFEHPENNVFQVTHQIKFREGHDTRIPDVIVYINGIPLIVMELKTFDENGTNATLYHAYMQLGGDSEKSGYRFDIPTLFNYNAFLVISRLNQSRENPRKSLLFLVAIHSWNLFSIFVCAFEM